MAEPWVPPAAPSAVPPVGWADRERAAGQAFRSSADQDDHPLAVPAWIAAFLVSTVLLFGVAAGSIVGLSMIFATVMPAAWSIGVAILWTGVAAGWLRWLWGRP